MSEVSSSNDWWDEINMTCCDFEFMEILETLDIQKKKDEREEQACKLLIYLTPKKLLIICARLSNFNPLKPN